LRFEDVDLTIEVDQDALLEGVVAFEVRAGGLGIRGAVSADDAERVADMFVDAANRCRALRAGVA